MLLHETEINDVPGYPTCQYLSGGYQVDVASREL